jgi:hypothetical protein
LNAYELADELEQVLNAAGLKDNRVPAMLRQQADQIAELEKELTEAGGMIGVLREYISDLENGLDSSIKLNKAQAERQVKELTDEEIMQLYEEFIETQYASELNVLGFGRAILRKAQEK